MLNKNYILSSICMVFAWMGPVNAQMQDSMAMSPKPVRIEFDKNVVCINDTVHFKVNYAGLGVVQNLVFLWNTDETTESIYSVPGINQNYSVKVFDGPVLLGEDDVYIYVTDPPEIKVVGDSICMGDEALLYVLGGTYYSWGPAGSEGTTDSINRYPLRTETYHVRVSNYPLDMVDYVNGCYTSDSAIVVVFTEPNFEIIGDTSYCENANVVLSVKNALDAVWEGEVYADSYQFNLLTDTTIHVYAEDRYGCKGEKFIDIKIMEMPTAYIQVSADTLCLGASLVARVVTDSTEERVKWFNGSSDKEITWMPGENTVFFVEVYASAQKGGCYGTIYDTVEVKECLKIFFPTGFRLNGVTNTFGPIGEKESYKSYYMAIFDRSGTMIYETNDPFEKGWNGQFKGNMVHLGAYIYLFKSTSSKSTYEKRGTVVVVN